MAGPIPSRTYLIQHWGSVCSAIAAVTTPALTVPQFQKIYVINLPSRTDHKDSMTLAAHFTGLEVEFVDGVTEVESKALPPNDTELSQPALGAWRAHMNIARRYVKVSVMQY